MLILHIYCCTRKATKLWVTQADSVASVSLCLKLDYACTLNNSVGKRHTVMICAIKMPGLLSLREINLLSPTVEKWDNWVLKAATSETRRKEGGCWCKSPVQTGWVRIIVRGSITVSPVLPLQLAVVNEVMYSADAEQDGSIIAGYSLRLRYLVLLCVFCTTNSSHYSSTIVLMN